MQLNAFTGSQGCHRGLERMGKGSFEQPRPVRWAFLDGGLRKIQLINHIQSVSRTVAHSELQGQGAERARLSNTCLNELFKLATRLNSLNRCVEPTFILRAPRFGVV